MRLINLERASDYEVEKWLKSCLKLTDYQLDVLRKEEIVRFSEFYFYKRRKKEKVSMLWRFSIILVPIYLLLVYLILPFNMIITGKWGYGEKFFNFHSSWMNKLGF